MKTLALIVLLSTVAVCARAEVRQVTVHNFFFQDAVSVTSTTTINQGDTVRWVWVNGSHTTTSATGLWNAPIDSLNTSFEYAFNAPGTYDYVCAPHSFIMEGQVIVLAAGIAPSDVAVGPGTIVSGNVTSLGTSDDSPLVMRPGAVLVATVPPLQVTMTATAPLGTITSFKFRLESSATANNLDQRILLFDYTTNQYVELDVFTPTGTDTVREITVASNFARFINAGDREVKARVTYKATGPVLVYPWNARIDQAQWSLPTS